MDENKTIGMQSQLPCVAVYVQEPCVVRAGSVVALLSLALLLSPSVSGPKSKPLMCKHVLFVCQAVVGISFALCRSTSSLSSNSSSFSAVITVQYRFCWEEYPLMFSDLQTVSKKHFLHLYACFVHLFVWVNTHLQQLNQNVCMFCKGSSHQGGPFIQAKMRAESLSSVQFTSTPESIQR